jgi:hypothetical protein
VPESHAIAHNCPSQKEETIGEQSGEQEECPRNVKLICRMAIGKPSSVRDLAFNTAIPFDLVEHCHIPKVPKMYGDFQQDEHSKI